MEQELDDIRRRISALRLTHEDFRACAGIERTRWWRAFNGKIKERGMILFVRQCEEKLDELEAAALPCSICGLAANKGRDCPTFGCPVNT